MNRKLFLIVVWATVIFLGVVILFLTRERTQMLKDEIEWFSPAIITQLCEEEIIGGKTAGVYKCGELLKRKPGSGVVDASDGLYSFDGKTVQRVESCGGMSVPGLVKGKPLCDMPCETINLCK